MITDNINRYWQRVKEWRTKLTPEPYIVAIAEQGEERPRNAISQVTREMAARCLADGSHRLATEQEVKELKLAEKKRQEQLDAIVAERRRASGQEVHFVVPEGMYQKGRGDKKPTDAPKGQEE